MVAPHFAYRIVVLEQALDAEVVIFLSHRLLKLFPSCADWFHTSIELLNVDSAFISLLAFMPRNMVVNAVAALGSFQNDPIAAISGGFLLSIFR